MTTTQEKPAWENEASRAYRNYRACVRNPNGTQLPPWETLDQAKQKLWSRPPLNRWRHLEP